MPTRTQHAEFERLASDAFVSAVSETGAAVERLEADRGSDIVLRLPDGRFVAVELKTASAPTPESVRRLSRRRPQANQIRVLVADRLFEPARRAADAAGWSWLDLRGHLRLVAPGLFVDTDVEPIRRVGSTSAKDAVAGRSGISLALALLMQPTDPPGVREIARWSGLSASAISQARQRLDEVSLLEQNGFPLVPELFWELVDAWASTVERFPVGRHPNPTDSSDLLQLGLEDIRKPGWAVAGATAAIEWGAPLVQGGAATVDYYVPSAVAVRRALLALGEGKIGGPVARIAPAPSQLVVTPRYELRRGLTEFPLVHPVVAALDLALDPSRGREVLEEWSPPEAFTRVW